MKKKVLFMIDSLACGGAEKSIVSLFPLLDYDKLDVTLMLVGRGGVFERYVPEQVRILEMPQQAGFSATFCNFHYSLQMRANKLAGRKEHLAETYWKCVEKAIPQLKEPFDYAIAYQQGFPTYYIADKVLATKKYAWVNVDLRKAGYDVKFNAAMYDKYDRVVAVSDAVHSDLINYKYVRKAEKIVTIYDILNPEFIRKMAGEQGFATQFHGTRIVTVGRMTEPKAYDLAVLTADELRKRGHKFRWTFVGDGGSRPRVEKIIAELCLEDCVELLGEKANPYPYMAACDVYVQTSRFEGFGLTVTEARILGKAEVCTNFPSAYNQITDGETGLICEMTPTDVADKIEKLLNDKELKAKIEANVAKEENHTAETESAKVNALLGCDTTTEKMKINTITCHRVYNHGAILQAWALATYLRNKGYDTNIIDYRPEYLRGHFKWVVNNPRFDKPVMRWLYLAAKYPGWKKSLKRKAAFDAFDAKHIAPLVTKQCYLSAEELKDNPPQADMYIAGSDQIWNTTFKNGTDPSFYLDFAPKDARRISYAASFATSTLKEGTEQFVAEKLAQLDAISVREPSGMKLLENAGVDGSLVCDPVFLIDADTWAKQIATHDGEGERYVLVYDFECGDEIKKVAQHIARQYGFKIYSVGPYALGYADRNYVNCGPDVFVALVKNAAYVISNSFHATAFSLIFQRDMFVMKRTDGLNTRMSDLLAKYGLSHRAISLQPGFSIKLPPPSTSRKYRHFWSATSSCQKAGLMSN